MIAGLTVIDPIVAIIIGLTVLGEAANAPLWAYFGFGVAGIIAVIGVYDLARNHPQVISDSQELPIERGSDAGRSERGPAPVRRASPKRSRRCGRSLR